MQSGRSGTRRQGPKDGIRKLSADNSSSNVQVNNQGVVFTDGFIQIKELELKRKADYNKIRNRSEASMETEIEFN